MSDIAKHTFSILKSSRGITLVLFGFMTIYTIIGIRGLGADGSPMGYWVVGFAFLVTIAGIVLTFLELKSTDKTAGTLDVSSDSPDFEHAVRQLSRNYDVLRRQATQGFVLAGTFMTLGICVILAGSVGEMFGFTKEGSNLTTIAGVVVEAISGIGLYLFRQTFQRLNVTSDRLHETWKILMAFNKAEALPEEKRSEVVASLITQLVASPHKDTKKG